jgi:hypothetical protein
MKPYILTRVNRGPGGRISFKTKVNGKKVELTGTIVEGFAERTFWWNYNSYYKKNMSSYTDKDSLLIKLDNGLEIEAYGLEVTKMANIFPIQPRRTSCFKYLDRYQIEKPRPAINFKDLVKALDENEKQELLNLLTA